MNLNPTRFRLTLLLWPLFVALAGLLPAAQSPTDSDNSFPTNLLLKDFKPRSMLHLQQHPVERAKFPVIDVHTHLNDAGMITHAHQSAKEVVAWMDRRNIKQITILSGAWGERLQRVLDEMVKPYPDRFIVFVQLDYDKIGEPNFGELMVAQIRDAVRRGARGLKVTKHLGLIARDKAGKLVPVDDPRFDPIWAECGRLGIPVGIHAGDPEAFFDPIDGTNERYEQLIKEPSFRFHGGDYPKFIEIIEALERVFAKHPQTTFISLHCGNWPENLDYVSDMLRRRPNVVVEFGARDGELGRQPNRARRFFAEFPDRVLFGTDGNTEDIYPAFFRLLESDDDDVNYYLYPMQGRWKVSGLNLPDTILEKVYHLNSERIFRQFKGAPADGK